MKLKVLYEFNFLPQLDPKQAKKYGLQNPKQHDKQFPRRSGNLETPPADPRHRKSMGVDKEHGTMAQKPGRPESTSVHPEPNKLGQQTFENMGQPYERGIENQIVGDDAAIRSVDSNDPLGRGRNTDGYSRGRMGQDSGRERANTPSMRRFQPFGHRYPKPRS